MRRQASNRCRPIRFFSSGKKVVEATRASHLLPVADAFNFSWLASARRDVIGQPTQLYNPVTKAWADRLLDAVEFRKVNASPLCRTRIGELRPEIASNGLGEVSLSHLVLMKIAAHWSRCRLPRKRRGLPPAGQRRGDRYEVRFQ